MEVIVSRARISGVGVARASSIAVETTLQQQALKRTLRRSLD